MVSPQAAGTGHGQAVAGLLAALPNIYSAQSLEAIGKLAVVAVQRVPGAGATAVCLRGSSGPSGLVHEGKCQGCQESSAEPAGATAAACPLLTDGQFLSLPLCTPGAHYGRLAITIRDPERFEAYRASVGDFADALSIVVEDRWHVSRLDTSEEGRRRRTEELSTANEALRESQRVARLGTYVLDVRSGRWIGSPILDQVLGLGPDDARTIESWLAIIHPLDREDLEAYLTQEVLASRGRFDRTYRVCRPSDGATRWVQGFGELQYDAQGEVVAMVGTIQDITERRARADELHRFASIFLSVSDMIALVDASFVYLVANPAYLKALGKDSGDVIGRHMRDVLGERAFEAFVEPTAMRCLRDGEDVCFEARLECADDGPRYMEMTYSPYQGLDGGTPGTIITGRDITQRKQRADERQTLELELYHAQKMESVGRLAGGVAHDLNNLLAPILGYGELLLDAMGTEDTRRRSVGQILRAGEGARDLVRQLLAFSRKQTLTYEALDLSDVVRNFEPLIRHTIREDIHVLNSPSVGRLAIEADSGQIEQVLMNLLVNAQDAMPSGGRITLSAERADVLAQGLANRGGVVPGPYALLCVQDSGCGIDGETQARIFDPFFTTKGVKGTGLGLSTAYGIIKQHGGAILLDSEIGVGTTFRIYLPLTEDTAGSADSDRSATQGSLPTDFAGTETILLVEDDPQVRELTRLMLSQHGYVVVPASGGREALDFLAAGEREIQLLLTDVVMPEMNGKELYREATALRPGLRVLYMSGYSYDVMDERDATKAEAVFIQKPFGVRVLGVKVREALERT